MSEDHQTVPASIWVRFAGDHIRMWGSKPFEEGEEYVRAATLAAKDAEIERLRADMESLMASLNGEVNEIEQLREALKGLVPILEAVRYTAGLGKGQWERLEKAQALIATETPVAAPQTAQEPRSGVPGSGDTPGKSSGDTR